MRQQGKSAQATLDAWTKDAAGNPIDWTQPPYKVGGVVNFSLPGERFVSPDELSKRRTEYMILSRGSLKK